MSMNSVHSPYKVEWLDSCLQETLLSGSPWSKIRDVINSNLAAKVKAFCRSSPSRVIPPLLDLLGKQFVDKYLEDVPLHFNKQETPGSSASLSESGKEEAQIWLQSSLEEITSRLGLNWRDGGDATAGNVSRDMLEFAGFAQQAVYRGMERELAAAEKKTGHLQENYSSERKQSDLLGNSHQSDTLGKALSALLTNHPSQLNRVCEQLEGRQLPNSLRPIIWSMRIQGKNAADSLNPSEDLDTQLKDMNSRFESALSWGLKELGVSNATHSPIARVIWHAVTEACKFRPGLQSDLLSDTHIQHAAEALNILYVFNRSYEPQNSLLVYPLIFALQNEQVESNSWNVHIPGRFDLSHKLAFLLHLLLKNCFPSRLQIFNMADRVIQRLHHEDEELYNHLVNETKRNISSDPQEFLVNFIHTEKEKAMLAEKQPLGTTFESLPTDAKELLFHPTMFIRKWIGEGFVGTLGVHAIMLVWDQCFMSSWQPSVMENTCLVMLQHLRSHILDAEGYTSIRRVLLDRPSELFTLDIQKGLSYLNSGGALMDVGNLRPPSQLPSLSEQEEIIHSPTPSVPESQHSPVARPASSRRSVQSTPLHTDPEELWVERIEDQPAIEVTTNHDSFDVYIDEVRFLPDGATVIKVTGRILGPFWKAPATLDIPDIEAFPLLDSSARCPKFRFRHTVRVPPGGITGEAVLLIRIYTLDVNTGELIVIGNGIIRLFNEDDDDEWHLNAGGHQLRLKHILPSTVVKLTEEAFDGITNIPVGSILIRLLPCSEEYTDRPGYSSGYYFSDDCKPNDSEWRVFRSFKNQQAYPPTVREAVRDVKEGEADHEEVFDFTNDRAVDQWFQRRTSKHLLMRQPAKPLELVKVVQYDQKQGLSLMVEQAFGLVGNVPFVNVLVYVSPGHDVRTQQLTEDGYGGEEKVLVKKRDFNSYQQSPKWIDPPMVFHPHLSDMTTLIIRMCSLDASYTPRPDRAAPGSVTANKGKVLAVTPFGWTVLQLFSKEYVNAGVHYLPVFEGSPSPTFLEYLSSHPVDVSTREAIRQRIHSLQSTSCIAVRLWDAHYSLEDCIPLPVREELLSVGKQERYKKAIQTNSGKFISDVVLQSLNRTERKQGVAGDTFLAEKEHYEQAMNSVFSDLLDDVLLESGMGPMTGE